MRSRFSSRPAASAWLLAAVLLALAGCGAVRSELPAFPEYPPARVYLSEQEQLRGQVQAREAYEARVRLLNQVQAAERANALWRRSEELLAQRHREVAFRESIRRQNQLRHYQDLQEFQSLQ